MAKRAKKRNRRRSTRRKQEQSYPGWLWMLFGLAIGLSVAFAVYVKDREPEPLVASARPQPASLQSSIDDNGEAAVETVAPPEAEEKRFDFYDMLPLAELTIEDEAPVIDADVEPQAIEEPGVYMLQAGSFSTNNDADRRRGELALHGIVSHIGRAKVNGRQYHRVYIGPIDELRELNLMRSRLRAAKIDVLRIRLGD